MEIVHSYQDKLKLEDGVVVLSDPFKLETGWLKEEAGINYWSLTLYPESWTKGH